MTLNKNRIDRNLQQIRRNVAEACDRVGRSPSEVSILPVTKEAQIDEIRRLVELGVKDLAESHVQQLVERAAELAALIGGRPNGPAAAVRWHMVGHLQRNKVKVILDVAHTIHSVDSLRLAEDISARAERAGRTVEVMLQVNCAEEAQKFGCAMGAAAHLAEMICSLKQLRLVGLMTIAPLAADPELARPAFVRLRELFEEMTANKIGGERFTHMSMGMSQDYTVAVEEGATILRIGTALFQ
jgi:hypothetical protein